EVQHLETEARPVQVHVASDPPLQSSTGSEVDFAPNGVAAEKQGMAEESIIATEPLDVSCKTRDSTVP
ncbi:hypothetical protein A2U01_0118519, partial [Trifolium medium]|nr:hypothetical protein [Trifolium medium]